MKSGSKPTILGAIGATSLCLLGVAFAGGQQAAPAQKPLMAEDVFKNVQVLRGIPVNEFMETMGFFAASLGANCTYCHIAESSGSWARYADDNDKKQTARKMVLMMKGINQTYFGGKRVLTCYSCHRFGERPKVIPSLAEQYGTPPLEDPDVVPATVPNAPPADQILDKYIQALGGAQKVAAFTTLVATGTYQGYEGEPRPVQIYAKAPAQRTIIVNTLSGNSVNTFDGTNAWAAVPDTEGPVPLLSLSGGDLDGARVEAQLMFPARLKQTLTDWRVGFPFTIGDKDVNVVQGMSPAKSPVKLYFDVETGLLLRIVRYSESPVGLNPTQVDYEDYRDVNGIKIPYKITNTWTDGRSVTLLKDVKTNVPVDASKFAKPAPPVAPTKTAMR